MSRLEAVHRNSVLTAIKVQDIKLVGAGQDWIWTVVRLLEWLSNCVTTHKHMQGRAEGAVHMALYL